MQDVDRYGFRWINLDKTVSVNELSGGCFASKGDFMKYKIEERVGSIAVVEESFNGNGLHPNMEGVIAYWRGKYVFGWKIAEWQRFKAFHLCNLLNAAQQGARADGARFCPECGMGVVGYLGKCEICGYNPPRR